MERIAKVVFFDDHKRKDVVEYRRIFLEEMKVLSSYFVEFNEDESILPKEYSEDCNVSELNQRTIIITIHDKKPFFANDRREKVWTLKGHGIFHP